MTDAARTQPGYFGKLPGLGDFVHRRLSRGFRDAWDTWLQRVVAGSRDDLGERWLDTYLSSPIWRWAFAPGPAGAWAGVLMPSVDRVGRYFPLTIAVPIDDDTNLLRLVHDAAGWFDAAEAIALSALDDDDFDLERFSDKVAGLGACGEPVAWPAPPATLDGLCIGIDGVDRVGAGFADLAAGLIRSQWTQACLWWSEGSDLIEPCVLFCDGLPDPGRFGALLDGQWQTRGWQRLGGFASSPTDEWLGDTVD